MGRDELDRLAYEIQEPEGVHGSDPARVSLAVQP